MSEAGRAATGGPRGARAPVGVLWLVLGLVLVAMGFSAWVALSPAAAEPTTDAALAGPVAAPSAPAPLSPAPRPPRRPPPLARGDAEAAEEAGVTPEQLAAAVAAAQEESMTQTGGPTGMALFPPPGTMPTLRGIVVPDDFPLPPGYVRHYQTTDDGRRLPAILMFHPDHPPRDAQGNDLPVTPDRLVPPELAPPGLPIEMLEPPADAPPPPTPR